MCLFQLILVGGTKRNLIVVLFNRNNLLLFNKTNINSINLPIRRLRQIARHMTLTSVTAAGSTRRGGGAGRRLKPAHGQTWTSSADDRVVPTHQSMSPESDPALWRETEWGTPPRTDRWECTWWCHHSIHVIGKLLWCVACASFSGGFEKNACFV